MTKTLSETFRETRIASGKSCDQVGRELGVAGTTVQRWEKVAAGSPRSGAARKLMIDFIDAHSNAEAAE